MNDVKKGTVTVVLATVVTSALILMTGKGNADNTESVSENGMPAKVEKTRIELVEKKAAEVNLVEEVLTTNDEIKSPSSTAQVIAKVGVEVDSHMPPPGPFLKKSASGMIKPNAPKATMPPVSPKGPMKPVKETQALKNTVEKPALLASEPQAPKAVEKVEGGIKKPSEVQLEATKPFEPNIPSLNAEPKKSPELQTSAPSMKPQVAKAPVLPKLNGVPKQMQKNSSQPIWMQGNKLNVDKPAPKMNNGMRNSNQINSIQTPNSNTVRYMQQYRYMPMPVYPNYQYPQMPRYNGGYYFAPVPNYWMQRGMQMPQPRMRMNNSTKASNEQKGLSK